MRTCRIKGKSADSCHNFVRVLKRQAHNSLLVCGTNACKPKCRTYEALAQVSCQLFASMAASHGLRKLLAAISCAHKRKLSEPRN